MSAERHLARRERCHVLGYPNSDLEDPPEAEPLDAFDDALDEAAMLAAALSSVADDSILADAARLRGELAYMLGRAATLAARIPDDIARGAALLQLAAVRRIAIRLFRITPMPSPVTIADAESGAFAACAQEKQACTSDRLASGTNPGIPSPGRARRNTRPDSPKALQLTSDVERDVIDAPDSRDEELS